MTEDPQFDFTDDDGIKRIVRITRKWGGDNFRMMVADIEDIETGDNFPGVPMTRLVRRDSE